jgi:hypothetical protein
MAQQQNATMHNPTTSEGENVSEIHSLTLRARDLSRSLDFWNATMIWALVFAALAAIAVVVATRVVFTRTKQLADTEEKLVAAKDKQLALDLKDKDLKIAELAATSASAETRAEGFRLDIAKAKDRAAQAEARAAEATLQLTKLRTPRTINAEQQKRISDKCKPFAGVRFDDAVFTDPESEALLRQIEAILTTAGWEQIDWKGAAIVFLRTNLPKTGLCSLEGVVIQMHPQHLSEFWKPAQDLASALKAEGIEAKAEAALGITNDNPMAIHVLIGKKPQ